MTRRLGPGKLVIATHNADVFYLAEADIVKSIDMTEEKMQLSYKNGRDFFYKKEVAAGEKPLEGDARYKPYEEVKEAVKKRAIQDEVMPKALELMTKSAFASFASFTIGKRA